MISRQIINYLDKQFREICNLNNQYSIFRIGSSLFKEIPFIHDIDYLLINEDSTFDFKPKILKLKREFSGKDFLKAAIITYDSFLDEKLLDIENLAKNLFGVNIKHAFGFGPIQMPQGENIIILHLAGPMNTRCTNMFFKQFPLFHLLWSKFNFPLGKIAFNDIIENPGFTQKDILEEYTRIYTRAINIDELYIKRQCLKRLKLVELALMNHPNPYIESFNQTTNKNYEEILFELEKFNPSK